MPSQPNSHRWFVVLALFLLSMLTYIDRVAISSAKDLIAFDLSLSDSAMGLVFSAFALGYALAQIPSGWFADRFGPRLALTVVVAAWSLLTVATGSANTLSIMVAIRFLFGIGEAGAFPGSARAIVNWLPVPERGRATGLLFAGSRLGAALSFPLLTWMLNHLPWRQCFLVLGAFGLLWALAWLLWFKDHPDAPAQPTASTARPTLPPLRAFLNKPMLLVMLQYFGANLTTFLCLSWMLPYMKKQYSLSDERAAIYAMFPLLFAATSQWFTGWLVDKLYRSNLRPWSRRLPAMVGFAASALALLAITQATTAETAIAWFTLAAFGADMAISPSWVFCTDLAGDAAGSLSGAMNMLGNFGAFVSANAFPFLAGLTGNASAYFLTAALFNLIGVACWSQMKSPQLEQSRA